MPISLHTNIASLGVQRRFDAATARLSETSSRLASGLRINRASDDAAGLSVASLLNVDRAVFAQGVRNLNDGANLLSIAESALGEMSNILIRIQEIAEQSANGTLTSAQRKPLQDEVSALQSEYNRILKSTAFNNVQLLTGDGSKVTLQAGYGANGNLGLQIGKAGDGGASGDSSASVTTRISAAHDGGDGNSASGGGFISGNGRYVVFTSDSSNIIDGVSGSQAYRRDLETNEVVLISSDSQSTQNNGTVSGHLAISADGRYAVFISDATNLIDGVSGIQTYRKDLVTGKLEIVSASKDGVPADGASQQQLNISADGRYVVFRADGVVAFHDGSTNRENIYRKDMVTGEMMMISETADGVPASGGSREASISADGRYVAFRSNSANLGYDLQNHIYVKDTATGELILVSSSEDGEAGNGASLAPMISADGRYVAFRSQSTNLVDGVSGTQIYRKDLITGAVELVSVDNDGNISGAANQAYINADGRFITFRTATAFVDGATGTNIYRKDMLTGNIDLVTRAENGSSGAPGALHGSISNDGSRVVFYTTASFVAGDNNGLMDVYVREIANAGVQELSGMLVSDGTSAKVTLDLTGDRLNELSLVRAGIGSSSARVDTAISNYRSATQSLAAASSQITDADMATEAASFVQSQIIQQSAAAVLAQAGMQPQLVLKLLEP